MTTFTYLLNRFFYRLVGFFRHWYFDSFRFYSHFIISLLEKLDRKFAFKITLVHLFEPLYQDRSLIGYILGFFFRFGRLVVGGMVYFVLILMAIFFYLIWLAVPLYIVYRIFQFKL